MRLDFKKFIGLVTSSLILILCFMLLKSKTVDSSSLIWGAWSFSELLINYPENTFVRRGLLGEVFQALANDGPAYELVQMYVFYNFLTFIFLVSLLLFFYKIKLAQYCLFLVSSFGFLNLISYDLIYHRKEVFIFNLFIVFLLLLEINKKRNIKFLLLIYLAFSTIVTSLIHEGMILIFLPFMYTFLQKEKVIFFNKVDLKYIYLGLSTVLLLLIITNSGNKNISNLIFQNLHPFDRAFLEDLTVDGIRAIGWSLKRGVVLPLRILFSGNAFYWLYILGLTFFTLYVVAFSGTFADFTNYVVKLHRNNPIIYLSYSIFFIGWDWGRWFVIIFYLYFFLFLFDNITDNSETRGKLTLGVLVLDLILSVGTIIPECCVSWTDPKILNNIEKYTGEIKFNY